MSLKIINSKHGTAMLSLGGIALTTLGVNVISSNVQTVHADVADSQTNEISENAKSVTNQENTDSNKETSATSNIKEASESHQQNNIQSQSLVESKAETKTNAELPQAKNVQNDFYASADSIAHMTNKISGTTTNRQINTSLSNYGLKGSFTIKQSDAKKGNRIYIGKIVATNNFYSDNTKENINNPIFSVKNTNVDATSDKYGVLGQIKLLKNTSVGNEIDMYLDFTSDKNFADDVNVSYIIPSAISLNNQTNLSVFAGATEKKPFIETITGPSSSFNVKFIGTTIQTMHPFDSASGVEAKGEYYQMDFNSNGLAWVNSADRSKDLAQLINSKGNTSINLDNYHRVLQLSGKEVSPTTSWSSVVEFIVVDANGNLTNETVAVNNLVSKSGYKTTRLKDNLTIQQVYDQTPENQIGISKQKDGTYLVGINLNPKDFSFNENDIRDVIGKYSYLANVQDPMHKQQIIDNTMAFEKKVFNDAPYSISARLKLTKNTSNTTDYIVRDVTPNDNLSHSISSGTLGDPVALADGTVASHVTYVFVDDDNNEATIGLPTTLYGKTGATVNPHLSIPAGYVLAPGQSLPGNYVLRDSNPLMQIHLKHQTGSAVINTPASQTDKDTSSTPATKIGANSDKQANQQHQSQGKNNDNLNNDGIKQQSKRNSSDPASALEVNKSSFDDNKAKIQPQKVLVKQENNDDKSLATQTQSQLPQTDSQRNNSVAMVGVAALTGSFAAMFAMNRKKQIKTNKSIN